MIRWLWKISSYAGLTHEGEIIEYVRVITNHLFNDYINYE